MTPNRITDADVIGWKARLPRVLKPPKQIPWTRNTTSHGNVGVESLPRARYRYCFRFSILVSVSTGTSGATIGGTGSHGPGLADGNLISGNPGAGVWIDGAGSDGNTILGNLIGTDRTGTVSIGNGSAVHIQGSASSNTVGGVDAGAQNTLSGNDSTGIVIDGSGTDGTVVQGNFIGTTSDGLLALGQTLGIHVRGAATNTTIGGSTAAARNLISGSGDWGVRVEDSGTAGTVIEGNWIGLDASGSAALPNNGVGIAVRSGATATTIGGITSGQRNIVSGNSIGTPGHGNVIAANSGPGIVIKDGGTTGNTVEDNLVGLASDGFTPLGNGTGIEVDGAGANTIGGGGGANEIAHSNGPGFSLINGALDITISRNSIHDNNGLAIDLENDGVSINDVGDSDDGANHLVNYPQLEATFNQCGGGGLTTVTGNVGIPGKVEFFASTNADPTGFGEAESFMGDSTLFSAGQFSVELPQLGDGTIITATFTDAAGNTSELSNAIVLQTQPVAPTGLQAITASGPAIDLDWVDNAVTETVYRIERRQAGTPGFSFLINLPAGSTTYSDLSVLDPGATYYYRVRAENGGCASLWSNEATALVPAPSSAICRTRLTRHFSAQQPYLEYGNGFFGATWRETDGGTAAIVYARLDASGAILDGPIEVTPWADESAGSQIKWNGSEWGHLWFERFGDEWGLMFQRFDAGGLRLSPAMRINMTTELRQPGNNRNRGLAWDGSGWGVMWRGVVSDTNNLFYSHIDSSNTIDVAEMIVDDSLDIATEPMLAFNGTAFGLVWYDRDDSQFHFRSIGTDGIPGGPSVPVTSGVDFAGHADFAWSGSEYGLTWNDGRDDDAAVYFRRLDVNGTPLSGENRISDAVIPDVLYMQCYDLVLRYAGDRWVIASEDYRTVGLTGEIQISLADLIGDKLAPDVVVSVPADGLWADYPALAWDGSSLLNLWFEPVTGDAYEIGAQATDSDGNPGANPRRQLTSGHTPGGSTSRLSPNLVDTGNGLAVSWLDLRTEAIDVPYLMLVDGNGVPTTGEIAVPDTIPAGAYLSGGAPVAFSGEVLAVAWADGRDGDYEIYVSALDPLGRRIGPERRITSNPAHQYRSALEFNGSEFLLTWCDYRSGSGQVWGLRLDADTAPLSAEMLISDGVASRVRNAWSGSTWGVAYTGAGGAWFTELDASGSKLGSDRLVFSSGFAPLDIVWDGGQFMLAVNTGNYIDWETYIKSIPCGFDDTAPSCPSNLTADSTTGVVNLQWTPGTDSDSSVHWQIISRDGARVAVVESGITSWADDPAPQGVHNYSVTTLNQATLLSAGCESVDVFTDSSCFSDRTLPEYYVGGVGFVVSLTVTPPLAGSAYAVEESPPIGWTVSDIDNGGSFDTDNAQVKWVFYDATPRILTYRVTPPAATEGVFPFFGEVSVDGGSQPICGMNQIDSGPYHPADLGDDWLMGIDEVTAYAAAWINGLGWPRPPVPIEIGYVTNAAFLWITGEAYIYDPVADPPYSSVPASPKGNGTATSTIESTSYLPGVPIRVSLAVTPDGSAHSHAVEDTPPLGWSVSLINYSGQFDPSSGRVKWGPFHDSLERVLEYTITPPLDATSSVTLLGTASFDGNDSIVGGERLMEGIDSVFADDFENGDTSAWSSDTNQ